MSPATDPGRAAEEMQEVRYLRAVIDTLRQELVTERKLVKGFETDLIAARKERDEARASAQRMHRRCQHGEAALQSLVEHLRSGVDVWMRSCKAAEAEAAQLRARLHEAEKGKTVDLDTAMKRGIRSWSAKLHIPVTRMMSRVLREEIHAALTPAPEANQEAGDGR
ncbi:hypothetical protein [Methylobacterium fujisawaense]|uniref:hypothetical protein n=1 Tax=Methylobacterium fujisawaense TaxID=107400 RepID=UPI00313CA245